MFKPAIQTIACILFSLTWTTAASAQAVAIVAAASTSSTDCRFVDTQSRLMASGQFAQVDIINTSAVTPTLTQLMTYDACICWTNTSAIDSIGWGDVMADYVDAGGGVVVAVFANSDTTPDRTLRGRWKQQPGYEVIVPASGSTTGIATIGNVLDPTHPVMAGITSISGGTQSFRPTGLATRPGSTVIAEWSDGRLLAVQGANPKRIDLGMYPPSDACSTGFWDTNTQGALLLSNALSAVAAAAGPGGQQLIRGECNNDGSVNLSDAVYLLNYLFPQGPPFTPDCLDACDTNDDGAINLPDAIALLNALFGTPPIPIADPSMCAPDPTTGDMLDCATLGACP